MKRRMKGKPMKAIQTKYLGPTDTKGIRIKASDSDNNSVTIHVDNSLNSEQNHYHAAEELCRKMKWSGTYAGGHTKHGMVWVCIDSRYQFTRLATDDKEQ
ncbi:MAG: hypothetical protein EHM35_15200 [Planctomycetaceae bacterium]|nr:MAG: hypothetical protein EHM35_15200 [Planctomycetaceae bacterium]